MKKTSKRVLLTLVFAMTMLFAMTITAVAGEDMKMNIYQKYSNETSILVEFDHDSMNPNGYDLKISLNEDMSDARTETSSGTNCSFNYLNPGTVYYVTITSRATGRTEKLQVVTRPTAPSDLKQVAASATGATIQWTKSPNADGYKIYSDSDLTKLVKTVKGDSTTKTTVKMATGAYRRFYVTAYKEAPLAKFVAETKETSESVKAAPLAPVKYGVAPKTSWKPENNRIWFAWQKSEKNEYTIDGIQVQFKTVDGKKTVKTTDLNVYAGSTTFTFKSFKNKGCKVRMRAYEEIAGKKVYGPWGDTRTMIPQANVRLKVVSGTKVKATWPKIANATKYTIYVSKNNSYSSNDKAKFTKVATVKGTSYIVKGSKAGKYTYVMAIPTVKVNGKTYTGMKSYYESVRIPK